MVKEYCFPSEREHLNDYYEMVWRCAKCAFCRNVFPSDTEHERFASQCPPGDRFKFEAYFASGRNELARRVIEGQQGFSERFRHILYTCTVCGACEQWCEATQGLHPLKIIMALRNHYVSEGGKLMPGHQKTVDSVKNNFNRLNRNNRDRKIWMTEEETNHSKPDFVYFVGCRSSFKRKEIARNTYHLLTKKLGLKIGLLADERCCGQPLIDLGEEKAAKELMRHNLTEIKATGAKKLVVSCAECFNVFSNVEKYGFDKEFEIVHLSQLLAETLPSTEMKLDQEMKVTYHDPCFLGRHQGEYDAPRQVLASIKGLELVEMPRNRRNAFCCGSGGGVQEGFGEYSIETALKRCQEIEHINADSVVTACPGCKNNLWGPSRSLGVQVFDLAEIVNKALGETI